MTGARRQARLWNLYECRLPPCVHRSVQPQQTQTVPRRYICIAATRRGRPPKTATVDDEEISVTEFGKPGTRAEDKEAQLQQLIADDDELADWTQRVVDWNEFKEDSPTAGFGGDVKDLPWGDDMAQRHMMVHRQMKALEQLDPNYIASLPLETRKVYPDKVLPDAEPVAFAPDGWNKWDFRAFVEKQKRVHVERQEWIQAQSRIGQFQYMHVDETTDVRMQNVWDEPKRHWSNEDIFNLIIDNGKNALPTDVVVAVENPKTKADLQMSGGLYHESNEEFLERTGHLLHGDEPTKEELDEALGIDSNFVEDFEGLDESTGDVVSSATGTLEASLADEELEDEIEEGMD